MPNLAALIILVVSFGGMVFLFVKRLPALRALELVSPEPIVKKLFKQRVRERMAGLGPAGKYSTEKFLKRFLMRTKILFLKGERKTDHYLRKISHSHKFKDDYWGGINKG